MHITFCHTLHAKCVNLCINMTRSAQTRLTFFLCTAMTNSMSVQGQNSCKCHGGIIQHVCACRCVPMCTNTYVCTRYLCMRIYVSMHLSIYIYLDMYLCILCIHLPIYPCTYLSMCLFIHVSIYPCEYVPMYLCMYLCMYLPCCSI